LNPLNNRMMSFRSFLAEISLNPSAVAPSVVSDNSRGSISKIVPRESDPSRAVIPLVIHPKHLELFGELEGGGFGREGKIALAVLERLKDQPRDGGLLTTNVSNSEAAGLRAMMARMVSDSEKVMGSGADHSVKDEAMRWMSSANAFLRALENGLKVAAG
jgi:hypothetical protein